MSDHQSSEDHTDAVGLDPAGVVRARAQWRNLRTAIVTLSAVLITAGIGFASVGLIARDAHSPAEPGSSSRPPQSYGVWAVAPETLPESAIPVAAFLAPDVDRYDSNTWGHAQNVYLSPCGNGITDQSLYPTEVRRVATRQVTKATDVSMASDRSPGRLTQFISLFGPDGARGLIPGVRALVVPCPGAGTPGDKNVVAEILANGFAGDDSVLYVRRLGGGFPPDPRSPRHATFAAIVAWGDVVIGLSASWDEGQPSPSTAAVVEGLRALSTQFLSRARAELPPRPGR